MTSSSEPELSYEQQQQRKVSAKLDMIEAIQMAEIQGKDLDKELTEFEAWAVQYENGLNTYKQKLKNKLCRLWEKSTEVYSYFFL